MLTEFGDRFLLTGACQIIQANYSLFSVCNKRSEWLLFRRHEKLLLYIRPICHMYIYIYIYICLWAISFRVVPHLPRLDAMVAKFSMCEINMGNLIYYFLCILFYFISFLFINNKRKQHNMLRNRPVVK